LHESFAQNYISLNNPPFSVRRIGWGYFDVIITIYWKKIAKQKQPLILTHELNFTGNGQKKKFVIKIEQSQSCISNNE